MVADAQKPFISVEFVRAALDALIYIGQNRRPNPLHYLALVDQIISAPEFPRIEHHREYALETLLLGIITDTYDHYRRLHGLLPISGDISLAAALDALRQCRETGAFNLMGWTVLYFRYVRVDLDITNEMFCNMFGVDARTLRRYLQRVLRQVTDILVNQEWELRAQLWRQHLVNSLPSTRAVRLWGRDTDLKNVRKAILSGDAYHFLITGVAGIGKTAFTQELIRRLIEDQFIDRLIWLSEPPSVQAVQDHIRDELLAKDTRLTIRDCLAQSRVAIILDGAEAVLTQNANGLITLLTDLDQAIVCMTSQILVPVATELTYVILSELRRQDVVSMIEEIGNMRYPIDGELQHLASLIADGVGGNPQAVLLAFYNIDSWDAIQIGFTQVFDSIYKSLSKDEKVTWLAFALFPPGQAIAMEQITGLWTSDTHQEAVLALCHRHLVRYVSFPEPVFQIDSSIRRYLESRYLHDEEARRSIDSLVARLIDGVSHHLYLDVSIVEGLLMSNWLNLPDDAVSLLLNKYWQDGLRLGHAARWQQILAHFYARQQNHCDELRTMYIYANVLRRVSEFDAAWSVLDRLISLTGHEGDFVQQGWAILESAILLRSQGRYEASLSYLHRAKNIGINWRVAELAEAANIEQAQILLDVGKVSEMHEVLEGIPKTSRVIFLEIEGYLLLDMPDHALTLLLDSFDLFNKSAENKVSVHILLGRCYDRLQRPEDARFHFQVALTLLEMSGNKNLLGRVQGNLGALLIKLQEYEDAYRLLYQAEASQHQLGDQVALAAIQHNLQVLDRRTAN
ncbi:MAG: tetratricopeptide repeat protein [Anaerolineaceae bacterium]|nr:tetratricopeptide repeat protein [Anaerolineaceae bacterium]